MVLILCLAPLSITLLKVAVGVAWFCAAVSLITLAAIVILINQTARAFVGVFAKPITGLTSRREKWIRRARVLGSEQSLLGVLICRWLP